MDQQFMLLNYLLLFPYENSSSKKIITTTTTIGETPAFATAKYIESTFYQYHSKQRQRQHKQSSAASISIVTTLYSLVIMGSCLGSLLTKEPTTSSASSSSTPSVACSLWRHQSRDEQETELMAEDEEHISDRKEKIIFRIIKFKRKQKRKQFIEKFWENQDANYTQLSTRNGNESISDIHLQNLDVNTLFNSSSLAKESIINAPISSVASCHNVYSRTSSSLDLEWEHEYGSHMRPFTTCILPAPPSATASTTHTSHSPAINLNDSWQFLAHRHYFDDDQFNSLSSQHSSFTAVAPPPFDPEHDSAERDKIQKRSNQRSTQQPRQISATKSTAQQRVISGCGGGGGVGSFTRTSSRTSCSHTSTPESLEWDIDEEQQRQLHVEDDNLGLETLELLHQIEQLKNKVLNETGDGLFDGEDDFELITTTTTANGSGEYREEINIS